MQLRVTYADGATVAGGERLSVVQTAAKPQVAFQGAEPECTPDMTMARALLDAHCTAASSHGAALYTLMLVDPDAPDPADPVRPPKHSCCS